MHRKKLPGHHVRPQHGWRYLVSPWRDLGDALFNGLLVVRDAL